MKGLSCFRRAPEELFAGQDDIPRVSRRKAHIKRSSTDKSTVSRSSTASQGSCKSVASNSSIAKLPPCRRASDSKIDAMMMPLPKEPRPSRCLRLSQPKTYSNIVDSMKAHRGCRDWRNFDVFFNDEIDMTVSAEAVARRRAADYERKLRELNSFSSNESRRSIEVDMIG